MNPILFILLWTVFGPFVVAGIKKIVRVEKIQNKKTRASVNESIALLTALGSAVGNAAMAQCDPSMFNDCSINWNAALMSGLAAAAGASYLRNTNQNVIGLSKDKFRKKAS